MAFPSAITFTGAFNLDTKLITLTDSIDYSGMGSGWVGYYTVTAPNGNIIYNGNVLTPDTTQATPTPKQVFAQLDSFGNILTGLYTFSLTLYLSSNVPDTYTVTKSMAFDIVTPTPVLDFTYNQFESSVLVTDNTVYIQNNIVPTVTETISLTYPTSIGYLPYPSYPLPLTSNTSTLSVIYDSSTQDGLFVNGKYFYSLASSASYNLGNGFSASYTLSVTNSITPTATYNMATLYCILKALKKRLDKALKVNDVLAETYQEQYTRAIQLMEMIRDSYICNQLYESEAYIQEFYEVTNSTPDCGCDNNDTTTPQLVVPITFVEDVEVISNSFPQLTVTKTIEKKGLNNFYTQFAIELNIGGTNNYQKLVYIDPNGDDNTGVIGNPDFPYKTFAKVNTLIDSTFLVIVNAGTYPFEALVFNTNASYYLMPNTYITTSNMFYMDKSPKVYGNGNVTGTTLIIDSLSSSVLNCSIELDTLVGTSLFGLLSNGKIGTPYFKIKQITVSSTINQSEFLQNTSSSYIKFYQTKILCSNSGNMFNLGNVLSTSPQLVLDNVIIDSGNSASTKVYNILNNAFVVHKNVKFKSLNTYLAFINTGTLTMYNDNNCYSNVPITTGTISNPIASIIYNTDASTFSL